MNVRRSQTGELNILLIPLILVSLLFVTSAVLGGWAYLSRQDYKNNTDQKIAAAVTVAKQQEDSAKDKVFTEAYKQPLKVYSGPAAYGSVRVAYPKTWSGYVDATGNGSASVDAYFNPDVVPSITDQSSVFALRMQVVADSYSNVLTNFNGSVDQSQVTASPYSFPKVPGKVGVRFDGQIVPGDKTEGSMIVLPLRDKTLEIWTESPQFLTDFNNNILPNVSFSP